MSHVDKGGDESRHDEGGIVDAGTPDIAFDPNYWAAPRSDRPLAVLPATRESVWWTQLFIDAVEPISLELLSRIARARECLARCRPDARLGEPGSSAEALDAVVALVRCAEREPACATLVPLIAHLRNPGSLIEEISARVEAFTDAAVDDATSRSDGMSLILFREHDCGRRLWRSFDTERSGWMCAIEAREALSGAHLALVPPPTAARAVTALAARLGLAAALPCVAMLDALPSTLALHAPTDWRVFPLSGEPNVTEELERIYRGDVEPVHCSTLSDGPVLRGMYRGALGGPSLLPKPCRSTIAALIDLALRAGVCQYDRWPAARSLLLAGFPAEWVARLPLVSTPFFQLASDLNHLLNHTIDGQPALNRWLTNLRVMTHEVGVCASIDEWLLR